MVIIWLLAILILMLVAPTTAYPKKIYNSFVKTIKFWEEDEDNKKVTYPANTDEFNKAIRGSDRRTEKLLTAEELTAVLAGMTFQQEVDLGWRLFKSTDGQKDVYMIFGPDEILRIIDKPVANDDEYKYPYEEYVKIHMPDVDFGSHALDLSIVFPEMRLDTPWWPNTPLRYSAKADYKGIKIPSDLKQALK